MQKIRSHEWDVGIQGCRINGGRINEGRLYKEAGFWANQSNSYLCLWSVTFVPLATQFTVNKGESLLRGLYMATPYYK